MGQGARANRDRAASRRGRPRRGPVLRSARSLEDRTCTPLPRPIPAPRGQVHLASRRDPGRDGRGTDARRQLLEAADCASTLACLRALGVRVEREGADVTIDGAASTRWRAPDGVARRENSGSTLRMLAGALAGRPFRTVLTGDESLRRRPVERVAAAAARDGRHGAHDRRAAADDDRGRPAARDRATSCPSPARR